MINDFLQEQKISDFGDFSPFTEFIKRELVSGNAGICKTVIKLAILLKKHIDINEFLIRYMKLINPDYISYE